MNTKPPSLRDRLKYKIEDLRLQAHALETDRWYTDIEISENLLLARHLRVNADLLAKWVREDESGEYET